MADFRAMLRMKAFDIIPGVKYNEIRQELLMQKDVLYEVTLSQEGIWEQFRDSTYPAFIRYLHYKSITPHTPQNVAVVVFENNQ